MTLQSNAAEMIRLSADLEACMICGDTSCECNRFRSSMTYLCLFVVVVIRLR